MSDLVTKSAKDIGLLLSLNGIVLKRLHQILLRWRLTLKMYKPLNPSC